MIHKTLLVGSLLIMAVSLALASDAPAAPANLTAEQIVAKNVAARGGLQAWRAVQTLSMSGKLEAGGNDSSPLPHSVSYGAGVDLPQRPTAQALLPFRLELKRARKSRLELDFRGQTAIQVYDGLHGWKLRPFLNRHEVEPFTPDEMKTMSMQSDLDGPLVDYAAKGTKVELEGTDKVEGRDTYRLKLTFKDGQTQHLWIDANTFLEAKIEGSPRRLDGKYHPVEIYYRDYRTTNGLVLPFVMETKVEDIRQTEKIEVEQVTVNPRLEDSQFARFQ